MRSILVALLLTNFVLASIGTVMAVRGKAYLKRGGSVQKELRMGKGLNRGDEIVTKRRSRVQVMLKDKTVVTIGSNSAFKFNTFFFNGSRKSKVKMQAKRGFFRAVTGKIGKVAPRRFTIKTTSATIGIMGTDFSAYILGDKEYFRCFSGGIVITVSGKTIRLVPGDIYLLNRSSGKLKKIIKKYFKPLDRNGIKDMDLEEINRAVNIEDIIEQQTPPGEICGPNLTTGP